MTHRPLFSIITVCRNAATLITPTLDSVAGQTFTDYEFIIIDGASSDTTVDIIRNHRVKVDTLISEPDSGIYDAMNKGRDKAQGQYLMFLNAGDSLHSPDTLAQIANAIDQNDFPGIVYGQTDIVDSHRRYLGPRHLQAPAELTLQSFSQGMVVCHQAFVALKKVTSRFDTRYRLSADYDWCIRCLQRSRHNVYIPSTLIDYLFEGESTRHRRRSLIERFRIMAYYYGTLPTIGRHLSFIWRRLQRRKLEKQFTNVSD